MQKRGQLTVFVLVAFVVLVFIVVLAVMYFSLLNVSISDKQFTLKKTNEVKDYIRDCINNGLIAGLKEVGLDGLPEYMKSIKCAELGSFKGIKSFNNEPAIDTRVNEDTIEVDVDYGIVIGNDKTSETIKKQSYSYNLYSLLNIDKDYDGKADFDEKITTLGDVAILTLEQNTMITNPKLLISIEKSIDSRQLSDTIIILPANTFNPDASLGILFDDCEDAGENLALINEKTHTAFEISCIIIEEGTYATAEIAQAGNYFLGSCDDFNCNWLEPDIEQPSDEDTGESKPDDTGVIPKDGGVDCLKDRLAPECR